VPKKLGEKAKIQARQTALTDPHLLISRPPTLRRRILAEKTEFFIKIAPSSQIKVKNLFVICQL